MNVKKKKMKVQIKEMDDLHLQTFDARNESPTKLPIEEILTPKSMLRGFENPVQEVRNLKSRNASQHIKTPMPT